MTIEIKIDSSSLADAKERLFGDLSSGTAGASGGHALAAGCAMLLIALYGLQSEIALSSAKAAEYKSQLADAIQKKLDGILAKTKPENNPALAALDNKDASTQDKEKAQRALDDLQREYSNEQSRGQKEQEKVSLSSNVLQGYMSQQSQGMQAFIKLIEALNPGFLSNLLARG